MKATNDIKGERIKLYNRCGDDFWFDDGDDDDDGDVIVMFFCIRLF